MYLDISVNHEQRIEKLKMMKKWNQLKIFFDKIHIRIHL